VSCIVIITLWVAFTVENKNLQESHLGRPARTECTDSYHLAEETADAERATSLADFSLLFRGSNWNGTPSACTRRGTLSECYNKWFRNEESRRHVWLGGRVSVCLPLFCNFWNNRFSQNLSSSWRTFSLQTLPDEHVRQFNNCIIQTSHFVSCLQFRSLDFRPMKFVSKGQSSYPVWRTAETVPRILTRVYELLWM
jgi:hypothetical protein